MCAVDGSRQHNTCEWYKLAVAVLWRRWGLHQDFCYIWICITIAKCVRRVSRWQESLIVKVFVICMRVRVSSQTPFGYFCLWPLTRVLSSTCSSITPLYHRRPNAPPTHKGQGFLCISVFLSKENGSYANACLRMGSSFPQAALERVFPPSLRSFNGPFLLPLSPSMADSGPLHR